MISLQNRTKVLKFLFTFCLAMAIGVATPLYRTCGSKNLAVCPFGESPQVRMFQLGIVSAVFAELAVNGFIWVARKW